MSETMSSHTLFFCAVFDNWIAPSYFGTVFADTKAECVRLAVTLATKDGDEKVSDEQERLALEAFEAGSTSHDVEEDGLVFGFGQLEQVVQVSVRSTTMKKKRRTATDRI